MFQRTLRCRNITRLFFRILIIRANATQFRRLIRYLFRVRNLIGNFTIRRVSRRQRTNLQGKTTITIPRRSLSNIQFIVKSFSVSNHLIATNQIRLIQFAKHTMFITNLRYSVNHYIHKLFSHYIKHGKFLTVQVFQHLRSSLLMRLFRIVPTRARFIRNILFCSAPGGLQVPLTTSAGT